MTRVRPPGYSLLHETGMGAAPILRRLGGIELRQAQSVKDLLRFQIQQLGDGRRDTGGYPGPGSFPWSTQGPHGKGAPYGDLIPTNHSLKECPTAAAKITRHGQGGGDYGSPWMALGQTVPVIQIEVRGAACIQKNGPGEACCHAGAPYWRPFIRTASRKAPHEGGHLFRLDAGKCATHGVQNAAFCHSPGCRGQPLPT